MESALHRNLAGDGLTEPVPIEHSLSGYAALPYFIIALSLGMAGSFFLSEMPFLMRKFGLSIEAIGWYSTASVFPYIIQPFCNPITDLWIKRKSWFVWMSLACAFSIIIALFLITRNHENLFYALILVAQMQYGLATSCFGGLAATTLDRAGRLKASNLLNLGIQVGGSVGATLMLVLTQRCSVSTLALVSGSLIIVPALAALVIPEPERLRHQPRVIARAFVAEARQTLTGRDGWLGLVLCICPASTMALNFFLPALAVDYQAPEWMTVSLNGFAGWFLSFLGVYLGGVFCLRIDSRALYIISAVAMAMVGTYWAVMPISPSVYAIGSIVYDVMQGVSIAACSAMVFELISKSSHSSSTQYSIFYAFSSIAQMYVLSLDTHVYARHGLRALYTTDAVLNVVGAALLLFLLLGVRRARKLKQVEISVV